jgi:PAS domain S-box-containing protein
VIAPAETRLRALLDAIPDLMLRLRRDGTYLDFAGDVTRLATPAEELVGSKVFELLPREAAEPLMDAVERSLEHGRVERTEYRLHVPADGALCDFEARVVPCGDDEVLAIVRDVTEHKKMVAQLRESRRHVVHAADEERNRLERNLHDGSQQRLIALSHHLHLVARTLDTDPDLARRLLRTGQDELAATLEEIRELVRGLHPSVLTRRGLQSALGALAARLPMPVDLSVTEERVDPEVEATAYYVVAEALANAAKHAGCSRAAAAVTLLNGRLLVEIADDGRGGADPKGSGLHGLHDRVEAAGGHFAVDSPAGAGTRIRAELPLS